nr:MAG TPA: hypothetical protein [Caudoviricetes sp.]
MVEGSNARSSGILARMNRRAASARLRESHKLRS